MPMQLSINPITSRRILKILKSLEMLCQSSSLTPLPYKIPLLHQTTLLMTLLNPHTQPNNTMPSSDHIYLLLILCMIMTGVGETADRSPRPAVLHRN